MAQNHSSLSLRLDNTSRGLHHATPVFGNIRCDICNICFKLISLNSQMKILSNDIKHYVAAKKTNLC